MKQPVIVNVDDHEVARYARSRLLTAAGFMVHDAATGKEAIEMAEKIHPSLIMLDVHLPDIHGFEVARILRSRITDEPFIIMQISASAVDPAQATEALNGAADVYITEPIDPEVLVATIRAMLRLQGAERSLVHANQELETANRELRRSNEDLEIFAYAASHDLQEPLRMISIFTQLIKSSAEHKLDAGERENLERVITAANRMNRLIHDVLDYSKSGRTPGSWKVVDLSKVVTQITMSLRQKIAESNATVEVEGSLPSVLGDESQLGQVFQNLISNSLKYASANVPLAVRISAAAAGSTKWTIQVRDNGAGIADQYHETIFAPFRRLHGSNIPGTGIGLALCRRIVEAHGGKIWVESKPGEGAVFSFTLQAA
jgi:signal transduction histidine kinase